MAWAATLQAASSRLAAAPTASAVADALLPACLAALDAAGAALAVVTPETTGLTLAGAVAIPPAVLAALLPDPLEQAAAPTPLADALRLSEPRWYDSREALIADYPHVAATLQERALDRWAFAPLAADEQPLGVLAVVFAPPQPAGPEPLALFATLAALAAPALARVGQLEAAQRHRARQQALAEASYAFGQAGQDLRAVLEQVVRQVSELVGGCCALQLIDADGEHRQLAALYHPDPQLADAARALHRATPQRIDEGLAAVVLGRGEPVLLAAVDQAELRASLRPAYHSHLDRWPISSMLMAPLRTRSGALGLVSMLRYAGERPYTPDDQSFLGDLADRAALAIANAQLYASAVAARAAAERAAAHTLDLQRLIASVSEAVTTAEVLAIIADQIGRLIGDVSGAIWLVTGDRRALEVVQMLGYVPDDLRPWQRLPIEGEYPAGDVVRTGEAQYWESREALIGRYPQLAQAAVRSGAWAITPLRSEGRALGVLTLGFPRARSFDRGDRALLELLARQCATAIQRTARIQEAEQARALAEHAADRTARLHGVSTALAAALTPTRVAEVIVGEGMAALGASAGAIYQVREDGRALVALGVVGYPDAHVEQWQTIPLDVAVPMAETFHAAEPLFVESAAALVERWPAVAPAATMLGDHSFAFVPLLAGGGPMALHPDAPGAIGAAGFAFAPTRPFGPEEREFLVALAAQCAQALDRARLLAAEQRAREQLAFLAEASTQLVASLDYDETLLQIVRLCVPRLADWCAVEMPTPDGRLKLEVVAHTDPAKEQWAHELRERYPATMDMPVGAPLVIRSGEPLLYPEVSDEMLQQAARDPEELRLLRLVGYRSMVVVPLRARERIIGTLGLISTLDSNRRYTPDDVALASELARRAGVALDNARLYQEAQEAIQVRNQFLSIAAHELKTPLTALSGQAQLVQRRLSRGEPASERLTRSIDVMVRQADRLETMVHTLLDVGRLERGQFVLERRALNLVELVDRVAAELRADLERHSLVYKADTGPLSVDGDPLRLEQVIHNLVGNAAKYSPAGGAITLRVERKDDAALISVTDEGIGIPEAELPQLFQRFYRAANVVDHHISGIGIGLYVVREIVARHGGSVDVTSAEGAGSTFTVRLPLTSADESGGA